MTKRFARNGRKTMHFEAIIQRGENQKGFTAQTANGTAKYGKHSGWDRDYQFSEMPEVPATGAWGNGNRTGE